MVSERPLNSKQAGQLAERVALVTASGLPLGPGLRAAAAESGSSRVGAALGWMAEQVEQGRSLEDVLAGSSGLLPSHVSGLLLAAARTGDLGPALVELTDHQRLTRELGWRVFRGLAYPLVVICLAIVVFGLVVQLAVGNFEKMFLEFGIQLPALTLLLIWWYRNGWAVLIAVLVGVVAMVAVVRFSGSRATWLRVGKAVPLFGPLWRWSGLAEWSGLMSVLIRRQIPLSEALQLAAAGVRDADLGRLSLRLAEGAGRGQPLSQLVADTRRIPASLVPLLRWGEQGGVLADALAAGRAMFESRVAARAWLLQSILPPMLCAAIGVAFMLLIMSLFLPLVSLVSALS
jgi:type II secretory pathway component PulF